MSDETKWIPPREWKHTVDSVDRGSPSDRKRLAAHLKNTFNGNLGKKEAEGLAVVISMTHDGSVQGFWGGIVWVHLNGAYESGDVLYSWC